MDINKMKSDLRMQNLHFSECTITRSAVIENGPMTFDLQKTLPSQMVDTLLLLH